MERAMTLEIVGVPFSNFVRSIRMVAEEKGVPYTLLAVRPHTEEVKALNPTGKIPAIRHDGLILSESLAIARYVDNAFAGPKLIPAEVKAAAIVDQWTACAATEIDQLLMRNYVVEYAFHKDDSGNVVRTRIDVAIKRFPRMFGMIGNALAGGYFGTDAFSMADCFLAPILGATNRFPEGAAAIADNAAVRDYFAMIQERPSFKATAA
jgi:glutathione S-transferase